MLYKQEVEQMEIEHRIQKIQLQLKYKKPDCSCEDLEHQLTDFQQKKKRKENDHKFRRHSMIFKHEQQYLDFQSQEARIVMNEMRSFGRRVSFYNVII